MPYCFSGVTTQSICTVVSRMSYLCCAWSKLLLLLLLAAATAAPHNIWVLCPTLATYLKNTRRQPARLFIRGSEEPISAEGITQGDPLSMSLYAISLQPLITRLHVSSAAKQCWFADDATGRGSLKTWGNGGMNYQRVALRWVTSLMSRNVGWSSNRNENRLPGRCLETPLLTSP